MKTYILDLPHGFSVKMTKKSALFTHDYQITLTVKMP